jgi:hypothetical protein
VRGAYSLNSPDAYLDGLATGLWPRFHVVAAAQLLRSLPVVAVLLALQYVRHGSAVPEGAENVLLLTVAVFELSLTGLLVALVLVHYRQMRAGRVLPATLLLALLAAATTPYWWVKSVLLVVFPPGLELHSFWARAVNVAGDAGGWDLPRWVHAAWLAALYLGAGAAFIRWRAADREKAEESLRRRRRRSAWPARVLERLAGPDVAPHLFRDLQLTARGFSLAVYVAIALALLFQAAVVFAAGQPALRPVWFERVALLGGALSAFTIAALAALLLQFQRPYFWVERSSGAVPDAIWKAKLWYACLLAIPAWLLAGASGIALIPLGGVDAALYLLRLAAICVSVASVAGVFAFEIAASPALGILLSGLLAMGLAGLYIIGGPYWPVPLFLYVYFMNYFCERAEASASRLGVES